ncbi:hypothetical protein P3S67_030246 [Capsicum chacoense]
MEKASLIVFLLVTSLFFSCDIVMGQKCSSISDCHGICKIGYRVCTNGRCNCCIGRPLCHNDQKNVVKGKECKTSEDCKYECPDQILICLNGYCVCSVINTSFDDQQGNSIGPKVHLG